MMDHPKRLGPLCGDENWRPQATPNPGAANPANPLTPVGQVSVYDGLSRPGANACVTSTP